ncbi:MAG: peptidoglycan-binding protein [Pararhodobacter sp.]|nr:peptidoglycan-binding protein [Pararhodobacter sp.]
MTRFALILLASFVLTACQSGQRADQGMAQRADTTQPSLSGSARDGCWATDTIPARTEPLLEEVILAPARMDSQGREVEPAVTAWRERMVEITAPEDRHFAVPCPEQMDSDFIAALQRALAVRGLYSGGVTGEMDSATRAAVRALQRPQGLDSPTLSLEAARQLGLVAVGRDAF